MDVRSRWATNEPLFKRVIDHESGLSEFSGVQGFLMDKDIEFLQYFVQRLPARATIVEIGSYMGLSTLVMARTLFLTGNLTARIFGVDTFEGSEEHQGAEVIKKGRLFDIFEANIESSGLRGLIQPVRMDSVEASANFPNGKTDMLFIDGDHTQEGCYRDLLAWGPKLKPGGIFLGHDLCQGGVTRAVVEYVRNKDLCVTLLGTPPGSGFMYQIHSRSEFLR